jgi:parallel beta-helix repeat protein
MKTAIFCKIKLWGLIVMLVFLLAPLGWAATYYVDATNGNDVNSGTALQPFKSISTAVGKANAGDTVLIASGTYRETINFPKSGSGASQTIAIRAMSGANVQIKGSDLVSGWTLHTGAIWKKSGWNINSQQVFVNGTPLQQIGNSCAYNTLAWGTSFILPPVGTGISSMVPGSFFYDQAAQTLYVYLPDGSDPNWHQLEASTRNWIISTDQNFIELDGLQFSHSNVTSIPYSMGMVNISGQGCLIANCSFTYADLAGLSIAGEGHQISNNIANFNGNEGVLISGSDPAHNWNIYPNRPPQNILLDGNETSYNNYRKFYTNWQAGGVKASMSCNGVTISRHRAESNIGAGIWFDLYSLNTRIERCIVNNNLVGIAYEISDNAVIANNLVKQNTYFGVLVAASSGVSVFNNTVIQNGYSIALHGMPRAEHPTLQDNIVRNNIISESQFVDLIIYNNPSVASGNTSDYNLFDGNLRITYTPDTGYYPNYTTLPDFARDTGQEVHSLNALPKFKSPATGDYQILAGSPAIDSGTDLVTAVIGYKDLSGNTRIVGGGKTGKPVIDMGAYEYSDATKPAAPTSLRLGP